MYLKYHKAEITPTTSVTSTAISSVKMVTEHKSLTNLRSEMIFLQGKPVFYILISLDVQVIWGQVWCNLFRGRSNDNNCIELNFATTKNNYGIIFSFYLNITKHASCSKVIFEAQPVFRACSCVEYVLFWMNRSLCRVKNMLAMYLKYHKAGLTPTTSVTSTAISSVKMVTEHKSLTNLRSEMIFLQGKPVFYIFLPSTPPYWQDT
jgi:hypothetical protein